MKKTKDDEKSKKQRRSIDPEVRMSQMTAMAMDLIEEKLRDGTASSQILHDFMRMTTAKDKLELEKIKLENELLKAKTESIQRSDRMEELYAEAIKAFSRYQGRADEYEIEDEY